MSLVERLGYKSLNELYNTMDNNEIMEWLAYDMIRNPEIKERLEKEIKTQYTVEQSANAIELILLSLGK